MDRRRFLTAAGAGAALAGVAAAGPAAADPALEPFPHGVASGDPLSDRVILWTRLSTGPGPVRWVVARDPALADVVAAGAAESSVERDLTVKVDAGGLSPGTTYYYGFTAPDGRRSLTGRTRTAPVGRVERLRLALVSCSSYGAGFFNPYGRIADRNDVDLVVHVGDYIYETAGGATRTHAPNREIISLSDYRERYAQYRLDPDLRRAHQAHPWVVVWDDHESANDSWQRGASGHQEGTEGPWTPGRKERATRAYDEWMPIRLPDPTDTVKIWRSLPWGDLADVVMIDTRLWGRNAPRTDTGPTGTESQDPGRSMLGADQYAFVTGELLASKERGTRWRVVGNQTMISPHSNNPATIPLPDAVPDELAQELGLRRGGGNEGADNWGAYDVERRRLIAFLRDNGIRDNVVLTGDIHTAWGCDIVENAVPPGYERLTGAGSVGVEIVCTSVTSFNLEETLATDDAAAAVNAAIVASNQNVAYTDQSGHGYTLVDVDRNRVLAEWYETGTARARSTGQTLEATYQARAGTNHLVLALAPSTAPAAQPAPPPAAPPSGPPAVIPELPLPALLPVAAAGWLAAAVLRRRDRAGRDERDDDAGDREP